MNTPNDAENAEDFEALYMAYRAKYEAAQVKIAALQDRIQGLIEGEYDVS